MTLQDHALEDLHAKLVAFDDAVVNGDRVSHAKIGHVRAQIRFFELSDFACNHGDLIAFRVGLGTPAALKTAGDG